MFRYLTYKEQGDLFGQYKYTSDIFIPYIKSKIDVFR